MRAEGGDVQDDMKDSRECPGCGQKVRVFVPAGGDGSALVYQRHTNYKSGSRCVYSRVVAR